MKRLVTAAMIAAATTAASWVVRRWLDGRYAQRAPLLPRKHVESWENEGGALAPQHLAVETSQVPR